MTEPRSTILVVEDDRHTRTFLADNLAADGFEPIGAANAREAVRLMETRYPDLAILDLTLPDRDGLELLKQVRESDGVASRIDPQLPMIVLSGRVGELHRLRGFDRGADDVIGKPFSYPELRSRVAALLRRSGQRPRTGRLRVGELMIDPSSREVSVRDARVELSAKEFALLECFMRRPGEVLSRLHLLEHAWDFAYENRSNVVDVYIRRLRRKVGEDAVETVRGAGYRLRST